MLIYQGPRSHPPAQVRGRTQLQRSCIFRTRFLELDQALKLFRHAPVYVPLRSLRVEPQTLGEHMCSATMAPTLLLTSSWRIPRKQHSISATT